MHDLHVTLSYTQFGLNPLKIGLISLPLSIVDIPLGLVVGRLSDEYVSVHKPIINWTVLVRVHLCKGTTVHTLQYREQGCSLSVDFSSVEFHFSLWAQLILFQNRMSIGIVYFSHCDYHYFSF